MSDINISEFTRRIDRLNTFYRRAPGRAATIAVNFSKQRFSAQNWIDVRTENWKKRQYNPRASRRMNSRATLVRSGRLKRSIRKIREGSDFAIVGTDVPYAAAHNYGVRGRVDVKSHSRTSTTGNVSTVKSFRRTMTLPRRQFMGESHAMARLIERDQVAELMRIIR